VKGRLVTSKLRVQLAGLVREEKKCGNLELFLEVLSLWKSVLLCYCGVDCFLHALEVFFFSFRAFVVITLGDSCNVSVVYIFIL